MITYVNGDLFQSPAKVLVNTVNTEGVMGKGIAKDFKKLFPEMFREYQRYCEQGVFSIGQLWLYKTPNKWVLNFPTKTTWKLPSTVEYVEAGLKKFVQTYSERGITSIAFPQLGCGNGELNWEAQVRPMMEKYLKSLPIDIFIHLYSASQAAPEHKDPKGFSKWLRAEPHALNFREVMEDIHSAMAKNSGRLSDPESSLTLTLDEARNFWLTDRGQKLEISEEDLAAAWNVLKRYGYLMREIVPSGLSEAFPVLLVLFGSLPYCRVVDVSQDYKRLSSSRGVQLIPSSAGDFFEPLPQSVKLG